MSELADFLSTNHQNRKFPSLRIVQQVAQSQVMAFTLISGLLLRGCLALWLRAEAPKPDCLHWGSYSADHCVTLHKILDLSVLQFSHRSHGGSNSTCILRVCED